MTTKIILNIDSEIAERVKKYARKRKTSIDKMMENQMMEILKQEEVSPAVRELAGILKDIKVKDTKREFQKSQLKKHSL